MIMKMQLVMYKDKAHNYQIKKTYILEFIMEFYSMIQILINLNSYNMMKLENIL